MENISVKQIISENNISIENLRVLLLQNKYETTISLESLIPIEVYNSIKDSINSNETTSIYSDNKTELYSEDNNTTQAYSNNTENSTEAYGSTDLKETIAYDSNIGNSSGEPKTLNHGIGIGDNIVLKDKNYEITEIISEGTGEAVIYKVENDSKNIYVLKLYFEFSNSKHEPNAETLERIKSIKHKDILKLVDYGVGFDKYQDKYCFEISEYAKGGDLLNVTDFKKKYTPSFIENNVIPEIFDGIKILHSNKIYHCDLKPGNIFYLDDEQKDLIIGDYGSAKAYDIAETKEVIKTSTVKGSNFYLAPEQSRGLVSDKNDFYSFGMILLHLLYPENFTISNNFKKIDNRLFEQIVERGDSSMRLIDYNPQYKRINKLIEGLTLNVRKNRWGENEVEKWIKKEDNDLHVKYLNAENLRKAKINLSGNKVIETEEQLIEFLFNEVDWKEELLEDETTKSELDNWLNVNYKKDKRVEINKILKYTEINIDASINKEIKKSEKIDYTQQAFIRYLKPKFPITINETLFNITEGNINENVNNLILKLDKVWQTFSVEKVRYILFQLEFSLKQLLKSADGNASIVIQTILEKLYSSLQITSNDYNGFQSEITKALKVNEEDISLIKILNLFYNFNENRVFHFKNEKCNTIEELGFYIVNNENDFENKYFKVEKNWFLKKKTNENLSNLNSKELVFEIFKNDAKSTIEYIELTFDKHRDYSINYKYYKSLTDFLRENKVSKDYTSRSENNETYNTKRNLFGKFGSVAESFIRTVKQKHNISNLSRSNENNISSRIVTDSWKRYIKVYQGQFIAAGCLVLLLSVIGVYRSNNTYTPPRVNNTQPTYQPTKPVNQYAYIKADPIGNIRSGTSTNTNILTSLPKGEKVYLVEQDKATEWYKVRYGNNNYGYVSDVVVSFDFVDKNNRISKKKESSIKTKRTSNTSVSKIKPSINQQEIILYSLKIFPPDNYTDSFLKKYLELFDSNYNNYKRNEFQLKSEIENTEKNLKNKIRNIHTSKTYTHSGVSALKPYSFENQSFELSMIYEANFLNFINFGSNIYTRTNMTSSGVVLNKNHTKIKLNNGSKFKQLKVNSDKGNQIIQKLNSNRRFYYSFDYKILPNSLNRVNLEAEISEFRIYSDKNKQNLISIIK